jgi:hypothetical protein
MKHAMLHKHSGEFFAKHNSSVASLPIEWQADGEHRFRLQQISGEFQQSPIWQATTTVFFMKLLSYAFHYHLKYCNNSELQFS